MSSAIPSSPSANDQVSNSNDSTQAQTATINVDPSEVEKFNKLAGEWWSNTGAFATLHEINPLRLNWIEENVKRGYASNGTDNDGKDADADADAGLSGKRCLMLVAAVEFCRSQWLVVALTLPGLTWVLKT